MKLILFNSATETKNLWPLTLTRPAGMIRVGILTIREKWERSLHVEAGLFTGSYLDKKYGGSVEGELLVVNGTLIPNDDLVRSVRGLKENQGLRSGDMILAAKITAKGRGSWVDQVTDDSVSFDEYPSPFSRIKFPWDIGLRNGIEIQHDLKRLNASPTNQVVDKHSVIYQEENVYIHPNATIKACIIDGSLGPVYIGDGAEIQPGSVIAGPCAVLKGSMVVYGAKLRQNTTIGPFCKVGGEINNSVFQGYSNKSHDGFLGTSVIGEWCNFGAGSNNSNLKNNYGSVKVWNYEQQSYLDTGHLYSGLIMGDHSKCGINTMFNTGTVVGVGANVFGAGYMPKFIPSFSWGGASGFQTYDFEKSMETARMVMDRRDKKLSATDRELLEDVFKLTARYRSWEDFQ